jgi:predicted acyltransferase
MPLSFERRASKGATSADLLRHVTWRGLLVVAIGLRLNLYSKFDFETVRIPGVLQRIGLCYALCGLFMVLTTKRDAGGALSLNVKAAIGSVVILVSYWSSRSWRSPMPSGCDPDHHEHLDQQLCDFLRRLRIDAAGIAGRR